MYLIVVNLNFLAYNKFMNITLKIFAGVASYSVMVYATDLKMRKYCNSIFNR